MKTIVNETYGKPDVLKIKEVAKPTLKENEVLVKIYVTTVTVADVRIRGFDVPRSFWLPARLSLGITRPRKQVLGMEFAGIIEAVGRDVARFKVGDKVFGSTFNHGYGAYAEYKCLPEDAMMTVIPADISFEESVVIPLGAQTALHYVRKANIQPGQKVLVYGASGSVGTYAVQLAKYFGAKVTGVCSTRNLELVKSIGADRVIDYTKEDFSQRGERYDVVFEAVDKSSFADCARVLEEDGLYLNVTTPFPNLEMLWTRLTTKKRLMLGHNFEQTAEDLIFLGELVEDGWLKPVIDRCYPLKEIVEAHRYVDTGRKRGNVVITVVNETQPVAQEISWAIDSPRMKVVVG